RVPAVLHLPHTGYDGYERPHDGHESGNDDGLAAVAVVELSGADQMLLVEEQRIFSRKQVWTGRAADRVAGGVAKNRRDREQQPEPPHVERARGRGQQSRGDQQRIARQKESDQQTRFREDDRGESDVSAPRDEGADVANLVQEVE